MTCDNCLQFFTMWESHYVAKNFFCELTAKHRGKHFTSGTQDGKKYTIEWGNERKSKKRKLKD